MNLRKSLFFVEQGKHTLPSQAELISNRRYTTSCSRRCFPTAVRKKIDPLTRLELIRKSRRIAAVSEPARSISRGNGK